MHWPEDTPYKSAERFRLVLKDSPVTAFTTDRERRLTWAYNAGKFCCGEPYLGRRIDEIPALSGGRELAAAQERVLRDGAPWEGQVSIMAGGRREIYQTRLDIMRDADGSPTGLSGVIINVTASAEASEAIERSELRYRSLVDATNAIVRTARSDGMMVDPQPSWTAYTGQTAEEFAGWGWLNVVHPDDREVSRRKCEEVLENPHSFENDIRLWHAPSGEYRYCVDRIVPVIGADGAVREWIGTVTDVHERRAAQEALRQSQERLRLAIEASGMGAWDLDLDTGRAIWSHSVYSLLGYDPEAKCASFEAWRSRVHPDDLEATLKEREESRREGRLYDATYRIIRANDGEIRRLRAIAQVMRDGITGTERRVGLVFDITDQKRAEEALKESEERFRTLTESTVEGVAIHDSERILDANASFFRMFGYEPREVLSMGPLEFFAQGSRESARARFAGGSVGPCECTAVRKDRSTFPVEFYGRPIDYHGQRTSVGIFRDITERKRIADQMAALNEDLQRLAGELELRNRDLAERNRMLEEASRQKTHFLNSMSHELRTPLNAVLGFVDLLAEESIGDLNDKQRRYLQRVQSAGRHLTDLVADILDLSRIEAGRVELAIESFAPGPILRDVLVTLEPLGAAKRIAIATEVPDTLVVSADRLRFRQILYNLLSNAIKYTPEGGSVLVEARMLEPGLVMSVLDTGVGIPKEHQSDIFDHFYQAQRNDVRTGAGLGLAITRRLVELHGGTIEVKSNPGEGSRFTFLIPARRSQAANAHEPS